MRHPELNWLRWGGTFGLIFVALQVVATILFFSPGAPPGIGDTAKFAAYIASHQGVFLAGIWLTAIAGLFFLVFVITVLGLIRDAGEDWEWARWLIVLAVATSSGAATVASAALGASVIDTTVKTEPVALKALFEMGAVTFGTLIWIPAALAVGTVSYVSWWTGVLPRWTAWVGYVVAALNLITTLSLFGGGSPNAFFTATGFAGLIIGLLPFVVWVACLSAVMLRAPQPRRAPRGA